MSSVLTLTATDRLARALREDHSLAARASGAAVWEAPQIKSLRQWVQDQWTASWPAEQLLNATQELVLWRDAVAADEGSARLLAPLAAAREARRADQIAHRYRLDPERLSSAREEHVAFLRWRRQVQARKQRERWIGAAELPAAVTRGLRERRLRAPAQLRLCGFLEAPTPAEQALLDALSEAGCALEQVPVGRLGATTLQHLQPPDAEAQYRQIAVALREHLTATLDTAQPPPRLIVALPDPDAQREAVESAFRPILAPWLQQIDGSSRALPWRWGTGRPLAEHPWVAVALEITALELDDNEPAAISRLLLSTALWSEPERRATAAADEQLRDRGWPRVRLTRVLETLPEPLRARFQALFDLLRGAPARALPSDWALHYRARLQALGWPGSTAPDSLAFQAIRDWEQALNRLAAMDGQLGRVRRAEAGRWLADLTRSTRFDPRVETTQPIQILPLDEVVGLPCDALFVADLGGGSFPGAATPSPFLPLEAQQRAGVPGALPAHWLARARTLAEHLCSRAPRVQLYAPATDANGAEQTPSPLFGGSAPWTPVDAPVDASTLERYVSAGARLHWPAQDAVPAVDAAELAALRADSALFKSWFESPFFAFCRYRLGVESLPRPSRGLDARRQGTLVHGVLQDLWTVLRDHAGLAALDEATLTQRITEALDARLERAMPAADYGRAQVQLERARLLDVMGQWLGHERRRIDAFTVAHLETEVRTVVGGLPLRLRIDRIDRVQTEFGERWLVLDYKTGRDAHPRGWNAETLQEPQLPLYASHAVGDATGVPQVDGICFAHLKDGHPAFVARTNWRERLIEPSPGRYDQRWETTLAQWREALDGAARGFLAGRAELGSRVTARSHDAELLLLTGTAAEDEA